MKDKQMFDNKEVSVILPYDTINNDREAQIEIQQGSGRLSLSGAQAKYSMVF